MKRELIVSGIYEIRNLMNGNRYIGSTVRFTKRWQKHLDQLRCQQHPNSHLQAAFNKYGEKAFAFTVVEYSEPENLIEREQYYLDTLSPEYNILPTAGSSLGYRHSKETRKKISRALSGTRNPHYGKHPNSATRAKMSMAQRGKHLSEKHRRKIGKAMKGRPYSAETRGKMSVSKSGRRHPMYGKHHSKETRARMSAAQSGERGFWYGKHLTNAHREKISEAKSGEQNPNYGKHFSKEHREKISRALKGIRRSRETRKKISEARRSKRSSAGI